MRGARFSPDGQTVLYAAAWEAQPIKSFMTRPGSPESSSLAVPDADLAALSARTGELALMTDARSFNTFFTRGTLARAPLSGGAPRPVLENVTHADFAPDGGSMAAIVGTADSTYELHFPIGTVRVKSSDPLSAVRVSRDGERVAFIAHTPNGDSGAVKVLEKTGEPRTLSEGWISIQGLAWSPDGSEVWFTATKSGTLSTLWGVSLDGRLRLLYRSPLRLQLEDVAPDGRLLVTGVNLRGELRAGSFRERTERELTWFDYSSGGSISADGKMVAFTESGEGAANKYGIFVRPADGGPALRVADGGQSFLSPDGKLVLVVSDDQKSDDLRPDRRGHAQDNPSTEDRIHRQCRLVS